MTWEISLREPLHFAVWATGAAVWTAVFVVLVALLAAITAQATYATVVVVSQMFHHHVVLRRTRADWRSTPREIWLNRFFEWGLMK